MGEERVIAIAGNPNVGKSTVFNYLTRMHQHTGNWPGKTVANAEGWCNRSSYKYKIVDMPGTYSLMAHSAEEEIARDFICSGRADIVVVVCDATCLERNLNLVLQIGELTDRMIVCVNLLDEAEKKGICVDIDCLSEQLKVPTIGLVARDGKGMKELLETIDNMMEQKSHKNLMSLDKETNRLMGGDTYEVVEHQRNMDRKFQEKKVAFIMKRAEEVCAACVTWKMERPDMQDRRIDKILTGRWSAYPIMMILLLGVLWLTITGANYPSQLLAKGLFWVQNKLTDGFLHIGAPSWLHGMLVLGMYRVLAWVVAVMLPPMAIFFPLFTLLEDSGYLPRIAYNLDKPFKKCCACGKQALCMAMGFGCNAVGVTGCRIIDSPRERLIAILTNSFVPCNGRFPTLIAIITMFFVGTGSGIKDSVLSAALLTMFILLGVGMTLFVSRILSKTILKGLPSSFTLELPPYRRPQIGKVIVRSILDRTLFVLGRAVVVAAPAGILIWIAANILIGEQSVLNHCADFLDPFAKLLGMDGVIFIAFILGFPANEIVVPIMIMAYLAQGSIMEMGNSGEMKSLFVQHGWTWVTAVCTMLFSLMHWPCSTTLLTIKKETGSWRWTIVALALPTIAGMGLCFLVAQADRLFL